MSLRPFEPKPQHEPHPWSVNENIPEVGSAGSWNILDFGWVALRLHSADGRLLAKPPRPGHGAIFPRYTYEKVADEPSLLGGDGAGAVAGEYVRRDNVTDEILLDYRSTYGPAVGKDEIFYYVYALLHAPDYQAEFAVDLKRVLPRIPKVTTAQDFNAYAETGEQLATLRIDYENVERCPLREVTKPSVGNNDGKFYRVQKTTFGRNGKVPDESTIIYNSNVTLTGIPVEAYAYMLGSRSAIGWTMERHRIKTDKASGIVNDPNDWATEVGDPRYILDLLRRVVTVSLETMKLVKDLPTLRLID